jgi:ribosomal protein S4E
MDSTQSKMRQWQRSVAAKKRQWPLQTPYGGGGRDYEASDGRSLTFINQRAFVKAATMSLNTRTKNIHKRVPIRNRNYTVLVHGAVETS